MRNLPRYNLSKHASHGVLPAFATSLTFLPPEPFETVEHVVPGETEGADGPAVELAVSD